MKQICYVVCTGWVGGGHRNVLKKKQHVGHTNQTEPVTPFVSKMVYVILCITSFQLQREQVWLVP